MKTTDETIREKPILFTGEMVRAIRAGRKTQTRRIFKDKVSADCKAFGFFEESGHWRQLFRADKWDNLIPKQWWHKCPFGIPGDRLWVKETHAFTTDGTPFFRADFNDVDMTHVSILGGWKPSIFMPRAASRITLEITGIRVERLLSISSHRADAIAEGMKPGPDCIADYAHLWNQINGKKPGCKWHENPWVWVIEFQRIAA